MPAKGPIYRILTPRQQVNGEERHRLLVPLGEYRKINKPMRHGETAIVRDKEGKFWRFTFLRDESGASDSWAETVG